MRNVAPESILQSARYYQIGAFGGCSFFWHSITSKEHHWVFKQSWDTITSLLA